MNTARRRAEWQIVLWGIFTACFVAAGVLPLTSVRHRRQVSDQGPYNSIDAVLREELELENGAVALNAALADLPKDTPISVVYCSTAIQALAGLITTQVLWPRNVQEVRCNSPYGNDLDVGRLKAHRGVAIFVSMDPPPKLGEVTHVGRRVHVVKIEPRP